MKAADLTATTLKAFLYGDPGSGKTTFLATAMDDPRTYPVLWFNCGGNPQSIRKRRPLPTIFDLEATKDLDQPYNWILNGQKPEHKFVKMAAELGVTLTPPYRFIVLDGVTEYQRVAMDELTGNKGKSFGDALTSADQRTWGLALARLTQAARLLYGLPIGVAITALEKQEQDALTGALQYGPSLWGQARSEVPAYSLLTMRLVRRSKLLSKEKEATPTAHSVAYIDQVGKFLAKDQYGDLPRSLAEPTMPQLMDLIYGPINTLANAKQAPK